MPNTDDDGKKSGGWKTWCKICKTLTKSWETCTLAPSTYETSVDMSKRSGKGP